MLPDVVEKAFAIAAVMLTRAVYEITHSKRSEQLFSAYNGRLHKIQHRICRFLNESAVYYLSCEKFRTTTEHMRIKAFVIIQARVFSGGNQLLWAVKSDEICKELV